MLQNTRAKDKRGIQMTGRRLKNWGRIRKRNDQDLVISSGCFCCWWNYWLLHCFCGEMMLIPYLPPHLNLSGKIIKRSHMHWEGLVIKPIWIQKRVFWQAIRWGADCLKLILWRHLTMYGCAAIAGISLLDNGKAMKRKFCPQRNSYPSPFMENIRL